jgi:hypothetical protein
MRTPESNAGLEFHDSQLERVEESGTQVLRAYIHRSQGNPGVDPGSGWSQSALLRFTRATIQNGFSMYPAELVEGTLVTPAGVIKNVVAVPAFLRGPVRLELPSATGERMVVEAADVELTLVGEPRYIEEFRP